MGGRWGGAGPFMPRRPPAHACTAARRTARQMSAPWGASWSLQGPGVYLHAARWRGEMRGHAPAVAVQAPGQATCETAACLLQSSVKSLHMAADARGPSSGIKTARSRGGLLGSGSQPKIFVCECSRHSLSRLSDRARTLRPPDPTLRLPQLPTKGHIRLHSAARLGSQWAIPLMLQGSRAPFCKIFPCTNTRQRAHLPAERCMHHLQPQLHSPLSAVHGLHYTHFECGQEDHGMLPSDWAAEPCCMPEALYVEAHGC